MDEAELTALEDIKRARNMKSLTESQQLLQEKTPQKHEVASAGEQKRDPAKAAQEKLEKMVAELSFTIQFMKKRSEDDSDLTEELQEYKKKINKDLEKSSSS